MDFNPEKQVFELTEVDQRAFGVPEVPMEIPVADAGQYLARAEFKRIELGDVDLSIIPLGAERARLQTETIQNISALNGMTKLFGQYVASPADEAEAWLHQQS